MCIVTLTTDFGSTDFYAGVLKGTILASSPQARIVDLSHQISPYNILEAAYTVKNAYLEFPDGTIHVIAVDASVCEKTRILLVLRKSQFFIMPDNGLVSLIFDHSPGRVFQLSKNNAEGAPFNHTVAQTIARLVSGEDPQSFAQETSQFDSRTSLQPVVTGSVIRGTIIHIDSFENAVVNISRSLFDSTVGDNAFEILFNRNGVSVLSKSYSDVPEGEKLCRFNESGMLEISINKGKAAGLLGLRVGGAVIIDFG
jgi:hypothetical protein